MAGRQLDLVGTVEVLDHELAAVILVRLRQEQRHRQVGSDAQAGQPVPPHRVVDMDAEMVPVRRRIAIEQRRKDLHRDRRRDEPRIGRQRRQHPVAELARQLAVRRQLLVALDQRRLRAGRGAAILPVAAVHDAAEIRHIGLAQDVWNTDQHLSRNPGSAQNRADNTIETLRPGATNTNGVAL